MYEVYALVCGTVGTTRSRSAIVSVYGYFSQLHHQHSTSPLEIQHSINSPAVHAQTDPDQYIL